MVYSGFLSGLTRAANLTTWVKNWTYKDCCQHLHFQPAPVKGESVQQTHQSLPYFPFFFCNLAHIRDAFPVYEPQIVELIQTYENWHRGPFRSWSNAPLMSEITIRLSVKVWILSSPHSDSEAVINPWSPGSEQGSSGSSAALVPSSGWKFMRLYVDLTDATKTNLTKQNKCSLKKVIIIKEKN